MWDEPNTAAARHLQSEAARRRRRASQRADLIEAARVLIPDHGIAVPLARIAVHAGLTRHAAHALFNATTDLATALVRQSWQALAEAVAVTPADTPADLVAALITAIRADAPAHLVYQALRCGIPAWQRGALAEADLLLARALGDLVGGVHPGLAAEAAARLARRVVGLARDVALDPEASDVAAEADLIAAMLAGGIPYAAAAVPAAAATPMLHAEPEPEADPAQVPPAAPLRPAMTGPDHCVGRPGLDRPAQRPPPRPRLRDPPAQAA